MSYNLKELWLAALDFAGDEQEEALGMLMSDAKEQEKEFMDQMKLDGCPQFEEDLRHEWLALPRETRASNRPLHTMIGEKPKRSRFRK